MPFEPACSLWLKMIGWAGERSLKSSGRLYIRIRAAATAPAAQTRPQMSHDFFMLVTTGLSGHHDGLDTLLVLTKYSMHPAYVKKLLLWTWMLKWYLPFTCSAGMFRPCVSEQDVAWGLDKADSAGPGRYAIIILSERA